MSEVIFTSSAIRDMQRLHSFLRSKNIKAARRAAESIRQGVRILALQPLMGRLIEDLPEQFREWLIDFGDSGYIVRYHIDTALITILTVRHQKEEATNVLPVQE